jgi:hypothetical protein
MPKLYSIKGIGAVYSNSEAYYIAKGKFPKEFPNLTIFDAIIVKCLHIIILLSNADETKKSVFLNVDVCDVIRCFVHSYISGTQVIFTKREKLLP